jgi:hypothetical protein
MPRLTRWPLERVLVARNCPPSVLLRRTCKLRSAICPNPQHPAASRQEVHA